LINPATSFAVNCCGHFTRNALRTSASVAALRPPFPHFHGYNIDIVDFLSMVRCEPPVGRRGGLTNDSGTDYPVQYQKAALAKCHPQDPQDPQTKNPQKRPIYQYNQFVTPKSGVIHWAAAQRHFELFYQRTTRDYFGSCPASVRKEYWLRVAPRRFCIKFSTLDRHVLGFEMSMRCRTAAGSLP
jgi:hypothetical protein